MGKVCEESPTRHESQLCFLVKPISNLCANKIQQLGLASEYKNQQSPIGNWLNHLFGLTFLPPAEVGEYFAQDFMSDKPQDSKVDQFNDYLVDTYIDSE
nr:unnamed protein product [Callosobruchus analis]